MAERGRLVARRDRLSVLAAAAGIVAACLVVGLSSACNWRDEGPARPGGASPEQVVSPPSPVTSPAPPAEPVRLSPAPRAASPSPQPLVSLAVADAASRTGVSPGDVRVVMVEPREWPDRSLGCPRPGMGYAQAITPGFLIVVEASGRRLEYHSDHAVVVACPP
jgi:hypothetical protein